MVKEQSPNSQGREDDHPKQIGSYRILDVLGEGGMAIVYLAEQQEPVKRQVALKIVKPGMDSKQVLARFDSERQALAVLNHPNIAKVFDGGITETGRPYFVMERVDGIPITDYCDNNRLTTSERIELFADICAAVQHAHHKGLIHRDLKPSNILVGAVDGKAQVRIIDFGIAKATSTTFTDKTLYTRIGQIVGTPQYMSPEQADLTGLDVDTRTDIYSLGVILYELLVGTLPLDLTAIADQAIKHALLEKDPPKPSTRITELGDTQAEIARARHTNADALRKQLKGDLDWVVMRAIEKDRTRRYETANALAMECQRYLQHKPVLARPPSFQYTLRRFARRNRVKVTAASITLVAIIAGAAAATMGFVRATEAERQARQEAEVASRVSEFLTELFQVSDPSEARGNSITAREILDRGAANIETSLDDQPDVKATLLLTMGTVYQNLGLLNDAEKLMEDALGVRRSQPEALSDETAFLLNEIGGVNIFQGDLDVAEKYVSESLEMWRRLHGDANGGTANALTNLAVIAYYRSDYGTSAELFGEALEIMEQELGSDHPDTVTTTSDLSVLYSTLGNYEEAVRLGTLAIERRIELSGEDHPDVSVMLGNLAISLSRLGRTDEARDAYYRSLEMQKRQLGEHRLVANSMNNVGMFLVMHGDLENAEPLLHDAHDMWVRTLGADNTKVFTVKYNLGRLYLAKEELELAEQYFKEAAAGHEALHGEDHEEVAVDLMYVAEVYYRTGRAEQAEPILRDSLRKLERVFPDGHSRVHSAAMRLGACLYILGREEEGEKLLLEHMQLATDSNPGKLTLQRLRTWVADFYDRVGLPEKAAMYRD